MMMSPLSDINAVRHVRVIRAQKAETAKQHVQRKFGLKTMKRHIYFSEHNSKVVTMNDLFIDMARHAQPDEVCMPMPSCIVKHTKGGVFEFAVEQVDCIKHYILEDL